MRASSLFIFSFLSLFPFAAFADLYDSLADVYHSNPTLASERENLKAVEMFIDMAYTGWQPNLGANANVGLSDGKIMDSKYSNKPREIGLSAAQNLFQGFKTDSEIKAAKYLVSAEKAQLYKTEQDIFMKSINAYIDVLNTREVLDLQKNNQDILQKHYDLYRDKQQVGILTKTDVAQAEARLERAKTDTINAETNYKNALEIYRNLYGYVETKYTPINLKGTKELFPRNLDEAEIIAGKRHPSILLAEALKKAADENITISKSTLRPSLDIKASAVKGRDQSIYDEMRDVTVGLYLTVPLYDQGMANASSKQAKYAAASLKERIESAQRSVTEGLRKAWNILEAKRAAIKSATTQVKANELALNGVQDEQERGSRTVLDVLDAQQELLDARVTLTRVKHEEISAYFSVISSVGNLTADGLKITKIAQK
ncbi:MAG: TolC family outer membrane protein [Lactobacillales bacterium]|jgi:TolC family type I secretion outer membrane protein|nr:TolC family outer membrane protein [Lactobacillales bacterium]